MPMTRLKNSIVIKIVALVFYFLLAFFLAEAQVTSDFSTSADGWNTLVVSAGQSYAPNYSATGGNPGGYISVDLTNPSTPYYFYADRCFDAPAKFLGNKSFSYNQNLTFDLIQSLAGADASAAEVVIAGGGVTIYHPVSSFPSTSSWTSYSVTLNETGWKTGSLTGAATTKTQMKLALSNITSLRIRAQYYPSFPAGTYSCRLDNVILNQSSLPITPTISSFTPVSGLPGTIVTINGSNFNPSVSQNAVYFNGVKGTAISSSTTQLTVSSPAHISYGRITITNLANGAQATTSQNFNPLFDNNKDFGGRVIASTFANRVDFGSSTTEVGLSIGDLDGDGLIDVLTSGNSLNASVFRNTGQTGSVSSTSFAAPLILSIPNGAATPATVVRVGQNAIADMDGDGKLDLVINVGYNLGGNDDNGMAIFLNQSTPGNLSFSSGTVFQFSTVNNNNGGMSIVDIDGDGRPEFLGAINNSACHLGIAQNLSSPGNLDFAAIQDFGFASVTFNANISYGDLTGDGKPEILLEAYLGGSISIYENISTPGNIALGTPFQLNTVTTSNIQIADMDNDGINDIVFKDEGLPSLIHIKKNNHTSGSLLVSDFAADILLSSLYSTTYNEAFVALSDVNGDNKIDIVSNDGANVLVYQNNFTSGTLSATSFVPGIAFQGKNNYNQYVFCGDVDGDSKPEIIVQPQNSLGPNFSVYRNESFPAPSISLLAPSSGPWATNVNLTGNSFSTGIGFPTNVGRLGVTPTAIVPASNTSATSVVPPGAISNRFSMTEHGLTGFSKPFNVTFSTNRIINSSSFLTGVDFTLSNNGGLGLAVADFDNDGKPDIVVDDNQTGRIFQNTLATAGSSITGSTFTKLAATLTSSLRLTSGDFDGDGKIDIVTGSNILYQNNSTTQTSFAASVSTNVTTNSVILVNHDFNLDGKPDLASLNGSQLFVYENLTRNGSFTPSGNFASFSGSGVPSTLFSLSGNSNGATANDFDGDGYDDIALGLVSTTSTLSVYLNNGLNLPITTAQFAAPVNFTANASPTQIVAADFDGDGKIDVALGYAAATLSIFKNQSTVGTVSFAAKQDITAVASVTAMTAQDLDGDGLPEIITTNFTAVGSIGSFSIFKNTSSGSISFAAPITFSLAVGRNPSNIAVADVNFDSLPDLILRGTGSTNFLTVFQNNLAIVTLTINTQPANASVCNGSTAQFSVAATGTTNITYQWQYSIDGVTFNDITNTSGYTNVATATLSVNTTGNFGGGFYRCRVNGDFVAQVSSSNASLTINALPVTPTSSNMSNCGSGSVTLSASGGTNGNFIWYDASSTVIAGQSNSSYITSVLSSSTNYFVAVTNGNCTSSPTAVTAVINTIPSPPTSSNVSNCGPGSVTLLASGGTNGNFIWYDASSTVIAGQSNSTYITSVLSSSTNYFVAITNGNCTSSPTAVTAVINTIPSPPTSSNMSNCGSGSVTLSASGGTNGNFIWYDASSTVIAGQSNSTYITSVLSSSTNYFVAVTNGNCTSSPTAVTAVINTIPSPPTSSNVSNCGPGSVTLLASGGTNGNFIWYDASSTVIAGQSNSSYTTPVLSASTNYAVAVTNGSCTSTLTAVAATINTIPSPPTSSNVSNCGPGSVTLSASGGTNGNFIWYDTNGLISGQVNSTYLTPVLSSTTTYSVAITNGSCTSAQATITATINPVPPAPTTTGASQCSGSTFLLTASGGTNGQYIWYTTSSGGSGISGEMNSTYVTPTLTTNTTYYVSINNGICESDRSPVIAIVSVSGCSAPVISTTPLSTEVGGEIILNLVPLIATTNSNLNVNSIVVRVQPSSGATATVSNGVLTINYNGITFSGAEQITIEACDTDGNCATQVFNINVAGDIIVYNGISPGGKNPAFIIEYISLIPETKDNTVYIFDRWQNLVWHGSNYDNTSVVFTGISDGGSDLPSGVYYYKINFSSGRKTETGFISLRRQ